MINTSQKLGIRASSKRLKADKPIEIWQTPTWKWEVFGKYQKPEREAENPYARWFCRVTSPFTYPSYDLGDTYVKDIKSVQMVRKTHEENDEGVLIELGKWTELGRKGSGVWMFEHLEALKPKEMHVPIS